MCKCTPEIRTPFCGRGDCLPPASREPTESLFAANAEREFARMAHGDHLAQFKADQLDAWERRLAQFSNRSDSTGYVGRIGVEVLTELRQTREQAEAQQLRARVAVLTAALTEQGLLQKTASGSMVWHAHDCPASFDFGECNYRCRVAREAFALAGTEPYVSAETRRDTEAYE